eukprot:scaffold2591_cov23-Tisochrysis_lutea.AAC.1
MLYVRLVLLFLSLLLASTFLGGGAHKFSQEALAKHKGAGSPPLQPSGACHADAGCPPFQPKGACHAGGLRCPPCSCQGPAAQPLTAKADLLCAQGEYCSDAHVFKGPAAHPRAAQANLFCIQAKCRLNALYAGKLELP